MTTKRVVSKRKPETMRQAQRWVTTKTRYLLAGVCGRCAAQAAWGHALGFAQIDYPPCEACQPLVDTFPKPAAGQFHWRKIETAS
jgi:hypothetical protein